MRPMQCDPRVEYQLRVGLSLSRRYFRTRASTKMSKPEQAAILYYIEALIVCRDLCACGIPSTFNRLVKASKLYEILFDHSLRRV